MTKFIHLRNHTEYTLSGGTIKIKKFVKFLKENNIPATAITDSNVMFGTLHFSSACTSEGIQPIVGCEAVLNSNSFIFPNRGKFFSTAEEEEYFSKVVLLAQTNEGLLNLISLISNAYLNREDNITPHITLDDFLAKKNGILMLSGASGGCVEKLLLKEQQEKAEKLLLCFRENFGDKFYLELQRHGWENEIKIEKKILELAYKYDVPLVATNDCYFLKKDMFEAQDVLSCIATSRYVVQTDRDRLTPEHYFKSEDEMMELFRDLPEAIENTINIAKRISTTASERKPTLPHFATKESISKEEQNKLIQQLFPKYTLENDILKPKEGFDLTKEIKISLDEATEMILLSYKGFDERMNKKFSIEKITSKEQQEKIRKEYFEQMQYELATIIQMDFSGYFLIVSDFIMWSKNNGVPIGPGRGSGAGSIVSWSLKITDLDPIKFSLFFERFLNPERVSMPDFDIDLCQRGRERTIKYVQEKYGKEMVAQIITFGKLQSRLVIKDVGRVIGMGHTECDKISKMIPFNTELEEALAMDSGLQKQIEDDEQMKRLFNISLQLEGLNRHTGMHAAGVVIGDKPLEQICPLYFDGESEMPMVQYDMKYAEKIGLVKFDFLGLKTLTIIKDTIDFIKNIQGKTVDIDNIDLEDQNVFEMLKKADTVGVFQIESSGMRGMLKQIKPDNIEDIIALISLFRPGPMDSIPTYIKRKHGLEEIDYPHEKIVDILKDTYGIIIYQEQVMNIAKILAGYTLGAADLLRRAMGKKIKEEMDKQRNVFVEGCEKFSNIDAKKANEIFDLLAKFAEYGFNKAHAASYAIIGFQTAYLKRYYPVEFIVANMNIEIADTDKIAFYLEDIKKHNIKVLPPDINISKAYFTIELVDIDGKKDTTVDRYYNDKELAIRYGLTAIKGIGVDIVEQIVRERESKGKFKNIFDFCGRSGGKVVNKKLIEALSMSGSFDNIHNNRRQIFESCEVLSVYAKEEEAKKNSPQMDLFGISGEEQKIYPRLPSVDDWQNYEKLQKEFESFGFYLYNHPLDIRKDELKNKGISFLRELLAMNDAELKNGAIVKIAGVVISTSIKSSEKISEDKTKKEKKRYAFLTISDPTNLVELSLFNEDLITEKKEWLDDKEHYQLVFECNVMKDEEREPRFIIKNMWLLEEYLQNTAVGEEKIKYYKKKSFSEYKKKTEENNSAFIKKELQNIKIIDNIKITIETETALKNLGDLLNSKCKNSNEKKTSVKIVVEGKTMQLADEYSLSEIDWNIIRNIVGVAKVE